MEGEEGAGGALRMTHDPPQKLARNGLLMGIRREKAAKLIQETFRIYKVRSGRLTRGRRSAH